MSVFLVFMFVFLVEFSGCLGGHFDGRQLIPPFFLKRFFGPPSCEVCASSASTDSGVAPRV